MTLFAFVVLISQFLENDMFSIEIGLEKTLTFKISLKQTFTYSSVIDYLEVNVDALSITNRLTHLVSPAVVPALPPSERNDRP